jgi:AcrR family transcriptional regulator
LQAVMNRKEREQKIREKEVLDVAEKLLFAKGYENTSLVEIAKVSEFSRPTLYKYFRSKEEIFIAVHLRGMRIRWRMLEQAMAEKTSPMDKLYAFGETYYQFARRYPHYLRLQLYWDVNGLNLDHVRPELFAQFSDLNEKARAGILTVLQNLFAQTGNPANLNSDWLTGQLFHTLRTVLNQTLFPVDPFGRYNDSEYYFQYLRLFLRALTASGTDRQIEAKKYRKRQH